MPNPTRVLLVDDQELMRSGFKLLLLAEQDIAVCGEASNGQEALEVLERLDGQCDVVLMDVRMPHMNGIEATERIAALYPPAGEHAHRLGYVPLVLRFYLGGLGGDVVGPDQVPGDE